MLELNLVYTMAKRFTDTDKWKKPFIRSLDAPYKLLWFYILDDCDHAGIWQVDFEVASIRTGQKLDEKTALKIFSERIEIFDGGAKWFIKDFVFFQYGELNSKNRLHQSVINILTKHKVGAYKDLIRSQGQGQGNGQGIGIGQGIGNADELELLKEYDLWTDQILSGDDHLFQNMFLKEMIPAGPNIQHWVLDHKDLLSRYPKMRPPNQQAFRNSCIKHIRENYKKEPNGKSKGNSKQQSSTATADYLKQYYSDRANGKQV